MTSFQYRCFRTTATRIDDLCTLFSFVDHRISTMMYTDLFDQLGGAGRASAGASTATRPQVPPLVSFKAGKIDLEWSAATQRFQCQPQPQRGDVQLHWNRETQLLEWQWYDRRDKIVVDSFPVTTSSSTFERVMLDDDAKHRDDRVYVWTHDAGAYRMYWMQSQDDSQDDEIVAKINQYLTDPASANPEPNAAATSAVETQQVDALSSILQNLGMPPASAASSPPQAQQQQPSQQLTLADLQGAMAQVAATTTSSSSTSRTREASLAQIITPAAIATLLEDESVCNRLIPLLPPEQQSREHLQENLSSPQVQQTLRSLTAAIVPDDTGSLDGLASVLANFQLPSANLTVAQQQPIQAFLQAVLESVQEENKEEEDSNEDEPMAE
jgi:hypothetical protein